MKVGILTYHFSDNFGALLQAYALRRFIIAQGHEAEFVNYHPAYVEDGGDFLPMGSLANLKANIKILYLRLTAMQRKLFGNREQARRFEHFRMQLLGVSGPVFQSLESLSAAPQYDLLIAGSDQIWNPSAQKGLDPVYFLAFGPQGCRRISYAASFGRDSIPEGYHAEAGRLLAGLDAIAVREQSGVGIVAVASGRVAECTPDPTLLHADYDELLGISNEPNSGHVFCYALRTGQGVREAAELVSGELNAPILSPYNVHRRWREIGATVYPGPSEWLSLVRNAGFVVTNSFHGAVFAIVFRKPFVVVGLPGSKAELNARVRNLLSSVGLMHRFIAAEDLSSLPALIRQTIDWKAADPLIEELRVIGADYLKRQLNEAILK